MNMLCQATEIHRCIKVRQSQFASMYKNKQTNKKMNTIKPKKKKKKKGGGEEEGGGGRKNNTISTAQFSHVMFI